MTLVNYRSIEIRENNEPLVDLQECGLVVESQYFEQGLSAQPRVFARKGVAEKLLQAQQILKEYRLKIWDAFRSRDTQNNIYQKYWRELREQNSNWNEEMLQYEVGKFVTPPFQQEHIPPHTTGGAIDVTLADNNGIDVNMGTGFDAFGPKAASFYFEVYRDNPEVTNNRKMLREALLAVGFTLDQDEWWHFDYGNQIWALKSGAQYAVYGEVDGHNQ
jgi:D-alanyl-D-alanine dipeptidase